MLLFKVITERDEIIIGLDAQQIEEAGGADAGSVGRLLVRDGQLAAWRYAVSRGDAGELAYKPAELVSVLAHGSVRIEPYRPALPVELS